MLGFDYIETVKRRTKRNELIPLTLDRFWHTLQLTGGKRQCVNKRVNALVVVTDAFFFFEHRVVRSCEQNGSCDALTYL